MLTSDSWARCRLRSLFIGRPADKIDHYVLILDGVADDWLGAFDTIRTQRITLPWPDSTLLSTSDLWYARIFARWLQEDGRDVVLEDGLGQLIRPAESLPSLAGLANTLNANPPEVNRASTSRLSFRFSVANDCLV
jgi:hypothetical protein